MSEPDLSGPTAGPTVGLIGAGNISHVHAAAWKALGARVLVHSHAGAAEVAEQYGFEAVDSLDEVLAQVEFVDIVTPSATHKELTLAAIKAGRDVICEKPLTLTAADSHELFEAAAAAGVRIYPAHVVRFFPAYSAAYAAVRGGRIGEVAVARFFRQASSPAGAGWYRDVARSGGVIMDLMVHDLDQARWICGEVTSVYAVQSPPTVDGISPVNVAAHVTLTHASGAISHLRATWGATGTQFKSGFSIAGSTGVLEYSSAEDTGYAEELQDGATGGDLLIPASTLGESPYLIQLRELAAALRGGPEPRVTAADGATAVYLAEAARESMATGATIDMTTWKPSPSHHRGQVDPAGVVA
ncbi:myo-inositol 2-dehydrogenase/D-chiro-inositol 1-dehydrogenase [Kribbella amoyensis]|uniref:Myo-inositol 2-dehydrogenase/D-chiro-inositol 1-dehydrogenase n=1 Tax=Kribbella amoyensis TaxID=996641 RepID=A0A561B977_9ACTN|nr:Gfo/Idh/MocA family oxidoreductase [Kribbella amoyensis]TWD75349.1 myo-inositol 2-dehydrogenase/D-chiro-inositol 1-dehydrogenase [Kribbella amoyensis]